MKIIFRGDSGFCRWKMLRWCERAGVDYVVGLAKNSRLLEWSKPLLDQAAAAYEQSGQQAKGSLGAW